MKLVILTYPIRDVSCIDICDFMWVRVSNVSHSTVQCVYVVQTFYFHEVNDGISFIVLFKVYFYFDFTFFILIVS